MFDASLDRSNLRTSSQDLLQRAQFNRRSHILPKRYPPEQPLDTSQSEPVYNILGQAKRNSFGHREDRAGLECYAEIDLNKLSRRLCKQHVVDMAVAKTFVKM